MLQRVATLPYIMTLFSAYWDSNEGRKRSVKYGHVRMLLATTLQAIVLKIALGVIDSICRSVLG